MQVLPVLNTNTSFKSSKNVVTKVARTSIKNVDIYNKPLAQFVSREQLKELVLLGKNSTEIAGVLGVSARVINSYINKYDLRNVYEDFHPKRNARINFDFDNVVKLIKQGRSIKEIANIYNCDQSGVNRFLHKNNLIEMYRQKHKKNFVKNYFKEDLIRYIQEDYSLSEIADALKCNTETVKRYLYKYDLMNLYKDRQGVSASRLNNLIENYYTLDEISQFFGRGNIVIKAYMQKYNLMDKYLKLKYEKIDKEYLYASIKQGKTIEEIALDFNCDVKAVKRDMRRYGFFEKYKLSEIVKNMFLKGVTVELIAKICMLKESEVSEILYSQGFSQINESGKLSTVEQFKPRNLQEPSMFIAEKLQKIFSDLGNSKFVISNYLNTHSFLNKSASTECDTRKELIKLVHMGLSIDEIADELSSDRLIIFRQLDSYGLLKDYKRIQKIIKSTTLKFSNRDFEALLKEGKSFKEIAEICNMSQESVLNFLVKKGLMKFASECRNESLINHVRAGKTYGEIAEEYNVDKMVIYKLLLRKGLMKIYNKIQAENKANKNIKIEV